MHTCGPGLLLPTWHHKNGRSWHRRVHQRNGTATLIWGPCMMMDAITLWWWQHSVASCTGRSCRRSGSHWWCGRSQIAYNNLHKVLWRHRCHLVVSVTAGCAITALCIMYSVQPLPRLWWLQKSAQQGRSHIVMGVTRQQYR